MRLHVFAKGRSCLFGLFISRLFFVGLDRQLECHVDIVIDPAQQGLPGSAAVFPRVMHAIPDGQPEISGQRRHGFGAVHVFPLPGKRFVLRIRPGNGEVLGNGNRGAGAFGHERVPE